MSAYRLQTFAPLSRPEGPARDDRALRAARDEAYRTGFLAGEAAATEAFLDDAGRLSSELVEALGDARLTNEAARRHVAGSLAPAIMALCHAVTPALAEAGLAAEIAQRVTDAVAAAPQAMPRLRCAPEVAPAIRALLASRRIEATVEDAPELLPREALLFWDQGYDHIDMDACVARIRACIASHLTPGEETEDHDGRRYG